MKTAKPVLMTFVRGPLHLIQAKMTWIPAVNIFTDERDKLVYVYMRDEMTYFYDPEASTKLTAMYETVKHLFKHNAIDIVGEVKKPLANNE